MKKIRVVIFVLMFMMLAFISVTPVSHAFVSGNYETLDGVVFEFDGVQTTKQWLLLENGWYYLDYDGSNRVSNGLLPLDDTLYIRSDNLDYTVMAFENTEYNQRIEFNISEYIEFNVTYDNVLGLYEVFIFDNGDATLTNSSFTMKDFRVSILYNRIADLTYQEIYDSGYNIGWRDGLDAGNLIEYNKGYEQGKIDGLAQIEESVFLSGYHQGRLIFGQQVEGVWYTASQRYTHGFDDGSDISTDVTPVFDRLIDFMQGVFEITLFPGVTVGALVMIPLSFKVFKWFMKMVGV